MDSTLHIWIGSDKFQQAAGAERVLEYSIRRHATCDFQLHWMRAGDPDWPVSADGNPAGTWKLGRPVDLAWPKQGWGTPFSCFRFAVPEMMAFTGRAVYFDADMLVLGDVRELLDIPMQAGFTACHAKRTDASVIDCEWFRGKSWWPSVKMMRPLGWRVFEYLQLLQPRHGISATLPWGWNDCDGERYRKHPEDVKLVHYTSVPDQPYRPYPSVKYMKSYPFCRNVGAGHLWWQTYADALAEEFGAEEGRRLYLQALGPNAPDAALQPRSALGETSP